MHKIINLDKKGRVITDLSKVKIPYDLKVQVFKVLNPELEVKKENEAS